MKIGNRIIEFGAIEVIDRRATGNTLHFYCNPNHEVEAGALAIHGLTNEFLSPSIISITEVRCLGSGLQ